MLRGAVIISLFFSGAALVAGVAVSLVISEITERPVGLIGFCPAFPYLGHLDRIPSSPAVLFSKWLKTSSMYHPPHQSPASHALSASEGPWLPMFKEDTTPEGNTCMQGMGLDRLCITRSHTRNVACGHTVTRGHGGLWAHRHRNIHRPIGPQTPSHTQRSHPHKHT